MGHSVVLWMKHISQMTITHNNCSQSFPLSPMHTTCPAHLSLLDMSSTNHAAQDSCWHVPMRPSLMDSAKPATGTNEEEQFLVCHEAWNTRMILGVARPHFPEKCNTCDYVKFFGKIKFLKWKPKERTPYTHTCTQSWVGGPRGLGCAHEAPIHKLQTAEFTQILWNYICIRTIIFCLQ